MTNLLSFTYYAYIEVYQHSRRPTGRVEASLEEEESEFDPMGNWEKVPNISFYNEEEAKKYAHSMIGVDEYGWTYFI